MGNKVTIPSDELVNLFRKQYDRVDNILQCCETIEHNQTDKYTVAGAVDLIRDIAEMMRGDITSLLYQFDDPGTKGETHVMPKQDEEG